MTNLEQTILREISALPENRRADVLAFIRFLKISLKDDEKLEREYDDAIKSARSTAKKYKITRKDIDAEIRAVRDGK